MKGFLHAINRCANAGDDFACNTNIVGQGCRIGLDGGALASLAKDDLAPATLRGYRYDLQHFLAWHQSVQDLQTLLGTPLSGRR